MFTPGQRRCVWCLALLGLCLAGCGRGTARPKIVPAGGVVMHEGKPVAGALVEFVDELGAAVRPMSVTDSSGAFRLTTYASNDGAPVGTYRVAVRNRDVSSVDAPAEVDLSSITDPHERRMASAKQLSGSRDAAMAKAKSAAKQESLPAKYASSETSGLSFDVVDGQENMFQIILGP
jgi:hypothetical protein